MQTTPTTILFTLLGAALAGCSSGSSSSDSFVLHNSTVAVAGSTPIVISGNNLAFLASEATTGPVGTDFNGDGDFTDSIAVAVNMAAHVEYRLDVAALDLAWIGNELYIAVDEARDGRDWNNDLAQDAVVLLHWSASDPTLRWIDDLKSNIPPQFVEVGTNLFYTAAATPPGATLSNLRVISSSVPLISTMIATQDSTAELTVELLAQDEGLVFLGLNEIENGRDLNTDTDALDTHVLALLDGTITTGTIRNAKLALGSGSGPFRARKTAAHDWDVGFLVSESDQGATNFNDPALFAAAWQATQCVGFEDVDTNDQVLHFLEFSAWNANPATAPPRNTGLAGRDKIAIASGFIACICAESDEGGCDLNQDIDQTPNDEVVRWTQIVASPAPILPLNSAFDLHAIFDCPGGTHGLAELAGCFVMQVSEIADSLDIDGDGQLTKNLLGWLLPTTSPHAWDFTHGASAGPVGASWMREKQDRTRLSVAFQESVINTNINVHVPAVAGEDLDTNDSVPTFAYFANSTTLTFPGVAIATSTNKAGCVIGRDFAFYRVDEAADSRDWNGDGDETDMILFRTSLTQGTSAAMSVLNNEARPAVDLDEIGNPAGAAFLVDEHIDGVDYNGDGTTNGYVVRYFVY